jgi:hypothetical protein
LFLATKLEAFRVRGGRDFMASHDLEDIVTMVDGRPEPSGDVQASAPLLRAYIANEIGTPIQNASFIEALPGHLPGDEASQARVALIRERLLRLTLV